MQYVLGNMLNGGGGLNPDGLSLDLQFAADKTLTARKGPTPVFTRASSGTFVGSDGLIQTAATNIPRFDHDPVTLASRGLLIEESRTNLLVRSEEFNDAAWIKVNTSVTANSVTSPRGTLTADTLVRSGTSIALLASADLVAGAVSLTSSIYAKAGTQNFLVAQVNINNGTSASFITFDLTNGTVGTRQDLINSIAFTAVATNVGNGWYRCSVTFTGGSTNSTVLFGAASNANNRDGTNGGTIFIWGAQLEAGSFATSYIPTTTGSVVRSADVCSISGGNFNNFYNQSEGTLFADITPQSIAQLATVLAVNSGSSQNQHGIYKTNAAFAAAGLRWGATSVLTGFVTQAAIVTGTDVAISRSKLSYAYKLDDFSFAYAGTIVGTDTSGTLPSPTTMQIGNRDGTLQINGHLASIRYYKKRLPNAKLQALTA
jgi:hypothetical protein